jgi:hypothetical protein
MAVIDPNTRRIRRLSIDRAAAYVSAEAFIKRSVSF